MSLQSSDLKLTFEEFYQASGIHWDDQLMSSFELILIGCRRKDLVSFLFLQGIIFFVSLIFAFPITLLSLNHFTALSDGYKLQVILVIALGVWLFANLIFRKEAEKWRSFLNLKSEVEQYQQVIEQLLLLEKLSHLRHSQDQEQNQEAVFQQLNQLKHSLILALETEKLLRQHKLSGEEKRSFLVGLENNLARLMSQGKGDDEGVYAQIYDDMLHIGNEVYQQTQGWRSF